MPNQLTLRPADECRYDALALGEGGGEGMVAHGGRARRPYRMAAIVAAAGPTENQCGLGGRALRPGLHGAPAHAVSCR